MLTLTSYRLKLLPSLPTSGRVFFTGLRRKVGNGTSIRTFLDPWIPKESTFRPITPPVSNGDITVSNLIWPRGTWHLPTISSLFCQEDIELILKSPLSNHNITDSWQWHDDKRGLFSVKSAYRLFMQSKIESEPSGANNKIWQNL